jgi:hypothetical protein
VNEKNDPSPVTRPQKITNKYRTNKTIINRRETGTLYRRHASLTGSMATATTTLPLCLPYSSRRTRTARSGFIPVRAAIVEASRPVPAVRSGQDYSVQPPGQSGPSTSAPVLDSLVSRDRTEDMQAEARAMSRAANASVYSAEFLSSRYDSQPFKVLFYCCAFSIGLIL